MGNSFEKLTKTDLQKIWRDALCGDFRWHTVKSSMGHALDQDEFATFLSKIVENNPEIPGDMKRTALGTNFAVRYHLEVFGGTPVTWTQFMEHWEQRKKLKLEQNYPDIPYLDDLIFDERVQDEQISAAHTGGKAGKAKGKPPGSPKIVKSRDISPRQTRVKSKKTVQPAKGGPPESREEYLQLARAKDGLWDTGTGIALSS